MQTYSVEDLNEIWVVERVIALLDQARNDEAQSIAEEWCFERIAHQGEGEGAATP